MNAPLDNAKALYLEAIRDGDAAAAIERYSGSRYTQHSTPVKDGKDGFVEFFDDFHRRNPVRDVEIVRAFEDGRYVFLHVVQNLNDGEFRYVTADIFDTDGEGKLIEHWDMIAEIVDDTVSGHSQVDGPTDPTDLHRTEQNKRLVRGFLDDVLIGGRSEKLTDYVSTETYIQHNPLIGDGLDGLGEYLAALAARGETTAYEEVHLVIGCGDFVAAMSEMTLAGVDTAVIDLFRVTDGRIVEHWDVMEEITPEETWVNSGKF
jgi:predicted SnoaL-like aldol condensation-catalyzing enzyme